MPRINIKDIRKLMQRYSKLGKTCFYKLGSSARTNPFLKKYKKSVQENSPRNISYYSFFEEFRRVRV